MNSKSGEGAGDTPQANSPNSPLSVIYKPISRRRFLGVAGAASVGTLGLLLPEFVRAHIVTASPATAGTTNPFPPNAKGMVIAEPTRCTGCRRCELACTEYNDGKAQPSLARIKVARNMYFGSQGAQLGYARGQGLYGNFLVVQDTCRQCAHPVPCQLACPNGAIDAVPPVNARVVNVDKCTGCRMCQDACPWAMTTFDEELKKASKCTLCNGDPECVKACPTGALQYVPWEAKSKDVPTRWVVPAYISTPPDVAASCGQCHK